jgi:hypothetical protein
VYVVGLQYYTTRKKISDITRELQSIAPWLTDGEENEFDGALKFSGRRSFCHAEAAGRVSRIVCLAICAIFIFIENWPEI